MSKQSIKLWFCDFVHDESADSIRLWNPIYLLLAQWYQITLDSESPDFLIYAYDAGKQPRFRFFSCPRIYYTAENRTYDNAECDYALTFEPNGGKNFRLPYYLHTEGFASLAQPRNVDVIMGQKKKFCNFIYRNERCNERNQFFQILDGLKKVDAAGKLFNNTPGLMDRESENWNATKLQFMRSYKFTIAFENEAYPGYVTEKITDAFAAGTIPIYWGCPNIAKEFNPKAFVHCRDFSSMEKVAERVLEIDADDSLYRTYLTEQPLLKSADDYQKEIKAQFDKIFSTRCNSPVALSLYNKFLRFAPRTIVRKIIKRRHRR